MPDDLTIEKIEHIDSERLDEIGRLRVSAWAVHIPEAAEMQIWIDSFDPYAIHWTVRASGKLIAAARMSVHHTLENIPDRESYATELLDSLPKPMASFNRLVVSPQARGRNLSRVLDLARIAEARRLGCQCAFGVTPSGPQRVEQLLSIGFKVVGHFEGFSSGPFAYQPTQNESVIVCPITPQ